MGWSVSPHDVEAGTALFQPLPDRLVFCGSHLGSCDARYHSSAASDIDDALAWLGIRKFYQNWSLWPKNGRDQLPFVHLRGTSGDLPLSTVQLSRPHDLYRASCPK